jgi:hypothetical protein
MAGVSYSNPQRKSHAQNARAIIYPISHHRRWAPVDAGNHSSLGIVKL